MADERLSDETSKLIERYHRNVARALFDYLDDGNARRLRGDRNGDQLILTFVLDDADAFHAHLNRLDQEPADTDEA